jgi:hypothetical protein
VKSGERVMRAEGQWAAIMASTRWLPGSTSMVADVTPRALARATSARISAEPTPWPCQASATTTPTSVPRGQEPARSAAMACPMMAPSRTATTASACRESPDSRWSMAPAGVTGAKNLR